MKYMRNNVCIMNKFICKFNVLFILIKHKIQHKHGGSDNDMDNTTMLRNTQMTTIIANSFGLKNVAFSKNCRKQTFKMIFRTQHTSCEQCLYIYY